MSFTSLFVIFLYFEIPIIFLTIEVSSRLNPEIFTLYPAFATSEYTKKIATKNKNLNTANQSRDYIVGSDYNVIVNESNGWFKPNLGLENSDVKEIIVNATSYKNNTKQETTSVLRAYAFNLGEGGSLNTKTWK